MRGALSLESCISTRSLASQAIQSIETHSMTKTKKIQNKTKTMTQRPNKGETRGHIKGFFSLFHGGPEKKTIQSIPERI